MVAHVACGHAKRRLRPFVLRAVGSEQLLVCLLVCKEVEHDFDFRTHLLCNDREFSVEDGVLFVELDKVLVLLYDGRSGGLGVFDELVPLPFRYVPPLVSADTGDGDNGGVVHLVGDSDGILSAEQFDAVNLHRLALDLVPNSPLAFACLKRLVATSLRM